MRRAAATPGTVQYERQARLRPFPLSAVVIARNEAANIERCLRSLAWCDERVVVDDYSTDDTADRARGQGARVVQRRFDSFAGQRNWALDHADLRHAWILMLDADEVMTEALRAEIEQRLSAVADDVAAYRLCRKTMFLGGWLKHSDGFPVWIMRLVRRGKARFRSLGHGEEPVPQVDGRVETLRAPALHYPFSRGISDWVERHNRYASREALLETENESRWQLGELFDRDRATRRRSLRALSRRLPGRPFLRFAYQFFFRGGFLEGRSGLAFSLLMAWYEGLIVVKRWELDRVQQGQEL